ncbi:uncharacterized protein LOC111277375 [Durio zibethinus]|uniref:Uncharacterized protein LOC111277375 n=1 Tax=Durio zibethinus TaxID=66656 RepID=A0A6P5WU18_DURZI|nr:uncharacterized protein LOC111277375 [Durio zibethinus]XP_022719630.1 uncharacterized protein LOC111277375 [Durio zibethinus]XP_022719684.1 uncharacterized protein LOC111277375 [Durio zibethinus]
MFQPFICGAFNHQEEDDHELWSSPNSTPRKSRRNSFCKRQNKDNKNPYSNLGLDKFSALLAELEEKKQKIYSQTGSQDISFVRFVYKNSTDCVPIVVKLKDENEEEKKKPVDTKDHQPGMNTDSEVLDKHPIETLNEGKEVIKKISRLQAVSEKTEKKKKSFSWNMKLHKWRRPSYYLPAFLFLILLLLVFFGRSVSILLTCIGWYIVPTIKGKSSDKVRRSVKKKDYVRKLSENQSGTVRDKSSPVRDHHRKS